VKIIEEVVSMEVVEASGSNQGDVDVRFDLGDWKLEMGENENEENSEGKVWKLPEFRERASPGFKLFRHH